MDPLSVLASAFTVAQPAKNAIKQHEPLGRALHHCARRAIERVVNRKADSFRELATAILRTIPPEVCRRLFLDDITGFGTPECISLWGQRFEKHIDAAGFVDHTLDLTSLSSEFANELNREVFKDAAKPTGAFFQLLVVDHLARSPSTAGASSTAAGLNAGSLTESDPLTEVSNMAALPLPLGIVHHPKTPTARERLKTTPMVVLAGEPGTGKSVLAQSIARSADRNLVWWFNGGSERELLSSCEALLREVSRVPGENPVAEVRELLGATSRWTVVIDDAVDKNLVDRVVPGNSGAGSAIVTTRNGGAFPRDIVVRLGPVDRDTAMTMARAHLDGDGAEGDLIRLVEAAEGNPLVIASISRFKSSSGSTWERVFHLLEGKPEYLLSHTDGTGYPASFFEVVTTALDTAAELNGAVAHVMTALAVTGGEVPRILVEAGWVTDPMGTDVDRAIKALKTSGIIGAIAGTVTCHSLTAHIAKSHYPLTAHHLMVPLLLRTVETLCTSSVSEKVHPQELSAVVERLDRDIDSDDPVRLGAHVSLAHALGGRGWIASARRHLEAAINELPMLDDSDIRAELLTRAAAVMMDSGSYEELQTLLTDTISSETEMEPLDRARLLVAAAWAAEGLNDADGAQLAIANACALAPGNLELSALRLYFERASNSAHDRATGYMKLVADETLPPLSRASFASLASRDLLELGLIDESVDAVRLALELDENTAGPESQLVARDCNDLGAALIEMGLFDEATTHLERSRGIYQAEDRNHPLAALPLLHLGRSLHIQALTAGPGDEADRLLDEADQLLSEAERLMRLSSSKSTDLAAILYARGQVHGLDSAEIFIFLREAIDIDREFYGDGHPEVGKDRALVFIAAVIQGRKTTAQRELESMEHHLRPWEVEIPSIVRDVLLFWRNGAQTGVLPALNDVEKQELQTWEGRLTAHS